MNSSHNSKSSSDSDNKTDSHFNRSREKDINEQEDSFDSEIENRILHYNDTTNCTKVKIDIKTCISNFDKENIKHLKKKKIEKRIRENIYRNTKKTAPEQSDKLGKQVIDIIANMTKSNVITELPSLPYGKHLTDDEFITLLKECVDYANYKFSENEIEIIKKKFLINNKAALEDLFKRGQALKDVIENAMLTILTSNSKLDQEDNFRLLTIERTTATPIIQMNFNNDNKYDLNSQELIDTFCSPVYIHNFHTTLKDFLDNVPSENKLKELIKNHFSKHYIYFCEFPKNILALTIHTGNIYIKDDYLLEYFNETNAESQIIIREKIILNIGHEVIHCLLREISLEMKNNFFIKSNNKNTDIKNQNIEFREKFSTEIQLLDKDESGNALDYNFFNGFYFDELYIKEAEFFCDIKNIDTINDYKTRMIEVLKEEKNMFPKSVNKFKKLNKEPIRRCIRSRILGTKTLTKEEFNKKFPDNIDSDVSEDS